MGARGLALAMMAAAAFTSGGLLMKPAHGMTRVGPTLAVLALFLLGAVLNARVVMLSGEVGPAYVLVLGIETVLAFGLGVILLGERASALRLGAVGLVLVGSILLAVDTYEPSSPMGRGVSTVTGAVIQLRDNGPIELGCGANARNGGELQFAQPQLIAEGVDE